MTRSGIVRAVAGSLLAVTVLALFATEVRNRTEETQQIIGVTIGSDAAGMTIAGVMAGGPADLAGLRAGDVITAIDGAPILGSEDYDRLAGSFSAERIVSFEVRRGARHLSLSVAPGVPLPWLELGSTALGLTVYLGLALFCLAQPSRDVKTRLLFLFLFAIGLEYGLPYSGPWDWVWLVFSAVTGLQMALELHLVSIIPAPHGVAARYRWVIPSYYVLGLGLGGGAAVVRGLENAGVTAPVSADRLEWLLFSVAVPAWAILVPLILLGPALGFPERTGRHQAALIMAGVLPWSGLTILLAVREALGLPYASWLTVVEPIVLLLYPIALVTAIFKFRLIDAELLVRRGLVYTLLTGALLVIFYGAIGAGSVLLSETFDGPARVWVVGLTTLFLGLVFSPLRRALEAFIYRGFFPERLVVRQELTRLAAELPASGTLPAMGRKLVNRLGTVFDCRGVTLLIADPASGLLVTLASTSDGVEEHLESSLLLSPEDPAIRLLTRSGRPFAARQLATKSPALTQRLKERHAELAVPLVRRRRLVGLVLLGEKTHGERFPAEELELLALIAHHVATVFENARLFESATRDSLTGLLRRERILEQLDLEARRARRHDRPLAVAMIDLDHFKLVNDHHGHLVGDRVLKWIAHQVGRALRSTDLLGRYGGEEFLVVLPETDAAQGALVAEKVRQLVAERPFVDEQGLEIKVTVSIGIADGIGNSPADPGSLVESADRALYEAKASGRNSVRAAAS